MNISLKDKRILVTGATGGVGSAVVQAILSAGGTVIGSYFQDEETADKLRGQGVQMLKADLRDRDQIRSLIQTALGDEGKLDALVYAAGNARDGLFIKMSDTDWDDVLAVHLNGLATALQAVLPSMKKAKAGKLIALGSFGGQTGRVGQANYAAAKAGTVGLVKTIAKEAGRFGVSANVVFPGFIDSKMTQATPPQVWERAKADSAMGRLSLAPVVASFIVWMLSDLCEGVTGQLFPIDSRIL